MADRRTGFFFSFRMLLLGMFSRVVRRTFFRSAFLLFLLFFVAPIVVLNVLATGKTGNWLLRSATDEVFNTGSAAVTWDEAATRITGPGLSLTGAVSYYNIRVKRLAPLKLASGTADYTVLHIPVLTVSYDLKKLPSSPITGVECPDQAELYFNVEKGRWLDGDILQPGSGSPAELPQLPSFIVRRALVHVRADSVLRPPEELRPPEPGGPLPWYDFVVTDLALLPQPGNPDVFDLQGRGKGAPFGTFDVAGTLQRDGSQSEILFAQQNMKLDESFVSALSIEVRRIYDQFQIEGVANISCRVVIPKGRALEFNADIDINQGRLCFVGFPLAVSPASARLHVHNNKVTIESIRGQRGPAQVFVSGEVSNIGEVGEALQVSVDIKDLLIDEQFRLALLEARLQPGNENPATGMAFLASEWKPELIPARKSWESDADWRRRQGFPEWPGKELTAGGVVYPSLDDVLPFVARAFTPVGFCNFQFSTREVWKGGEEAIKLPDGRTRMKRITDRDQKWFVYIRDASACYVGLPELGDGGFPIPIFKGYGVVEGTVKTGTPSVFVVRGYTQEELARIPEAEERGMRPSTFLTSERQKPGQKVQLRATYRDPEQNGDPDLVLNVTTDGIVMDEELRSALPESIRKVVATFDPKGRADVESADVRIIPAKDYIDYVFTIRARGVLAQYQFEGATRPIELADIDGSLRISNLTGTVEVSSLRGRLAGSQVYMDVTFKDGDPNPSYTFSGGSDEFTIVPVIADMLPPTLAKVFADFAPTGNLLLRVKGRKDVPDLENLVEAEVVFRGGGARFVKFPYALSAMGGRVFAKVTDSQVEVMLQQLTASGSTKDSKVSVGGHVLVPLKKEGDALDPQPRYDLLLTAEHVALDSALMEALTPVLQAPGTTEKPALISFVESLNLQGAVGVKGRLLSDEKGEAQWAFELALEGCRMNFSKFPYPVTDLTGTVLIDGKDVTFRNVRGRTQGEGRVTLNEAGFDEKTGWSVAISARAVPFNQVLRDALPPTLMKRFDAAKPVGVFDIDIALHGHGELMEFDFSADLHDCTLDAGLHFEHVSARVDATGFLDEARTCANGRLRVDSLRWKDAEFNDVTADIQFANSRLSLPNLRGKFYDGHVEGNVNVDETDYDGGMVIRSADLSKLGAAAFPAAGKLQGAVDGEVLFYSKPDGNGQVGRGRLDIAPLDVNSPDETRNRAKLASVPLSSQIFATTKNPQDFDEGHVYFWLGADRITIREMDFVSDAARVETFGGDEANYLMYASGEMRMKLFFTLAPRSPLDIPVIQQVFDLLKQVLFPLYVTGTLASPKVEAFSLAQADLDKQRDVFPKPPREN